MKYIIKSTDSDAKSTDTDSYNNNGAGWGFLYDDTGQMYNFYYGVYSQKCGQDRKPIVLTHNMARLILSRIKKAIKNQMIESKTKMSIEDVLSFWDIEEIK